jgi:RNA polymerase sigma-70 factor (ECF subfamily)
LAGSEHARTEFVERMKCVPRILAAKNARMGSPLNDADVEDVVQETLVSVWRRLPTFEGRAALETWVYRFCHLKLCKFLESRRRVPRPVEELEEEEQEGAAPGDPDEFEQVYLALDRIDEGEAAVLRLKHFEQLTFEEIGRSLGVSPNTAKTRYYRGLERLRDLLEPARAEGSL